MKPDDDTRAQYAAAVAATGSPHPSEAQVLFELRRLDEETPLEFIERVKAILAHHHRDQLPEVRIEQALRELRFEVEPPPGWQALTWARIDAEEARRRNRWYRRLWRWMRGVR